MKKQTLAKTILVLVMSLGIASVSVGYAQSAVRQTSTNSQRTNASGIKVEVQFGSRGSTFIIDFENNTTASQVAASIGTSQLNLPIYNYDNFDNWDVMQYYDIPRRFKIEGNPVKITSAKQGEVYYSYPNRVLMFYKDAQITGEYTKIGTFETTKGLVNAVTNNPVVQGWGNKIVSVRVIN